MDTVLSNDVTRRIEEASEASQVWHRVSPKERAKTLGRIRRRIALSQHRLASVISEETSRPVTDVMIQEITASLGMIRHLEKKYPRWLRNNSFRNVAPGFWTKSNHVAYDPIGLVAVIGPSNFPFSLVVMQTCAALMCGNAVVLKPSEKCPRVAAELNDLFGADCTPSGVVSVVSGGASAAKEIIADPKVAKVFFTGSTEAGRSVAKLCGEHFKPCVLELGGDGPAIVCDDADLTLAARGIVWSSFYASGKSCIGTRRVYASSLIRGILSDRLNNERSKLRIGSSKEAGIDVIEAMPLEIKVTQVESLSDAVKRINDSPHGLSASIWSKDLRKARRLASDLRVGMVWINDASAALPSFAWGGVRSSGWGRLYSRDAIPELTQLKTVSIDRRLTSRPKPWWFPYSSEKYHLTAAVNTFLFADRRWRGFRAVMEALFRYLRK